jgi:hypothetical protein
MKIKLNDIISTIFTVIATGAVTWLVTTSVSQDQTKIRYIDYDITTSSILQNNQNVLKDKLKITIGNEANNTFREINQVTLKLYNLSDKDFEKLKLNVDFSLIKSEDKSFRIISQEIKNEYKDNTARSDGKSLDDFSTSKFIYDIARINRSDWRESSPNKSLNNGTFGDYLGISPVFQITYTIAGQKRILSDKIVPKIDGLGVKSRDIDTSLRNMQEYKAFQEENWAEWIFLKMPFLIIIIIAITYIGLICVFYKLQKHTLIKKENKFIDLVKERLISKQDLSRIHQIVDPVILSKELVDISRSVRNQELDRKFQDALVDNFSHINAINEFKNLNESQVADMLSAMYKNSFKRK